MSSSRSLSSEPVRLHWRLCSRRGLREVSLTAEASAFDRQALLSCCLRVVSMSPGLQLWLCHVVAWLCTLCGSIWKEGRYTTYSRVLSGFQSGSPVVDGKYFFLLSHSFYEEPAVQASFGSLLSIT